LHHKLVTVNNKHKKVYTQLFLDINTNATQIPRNVKYRKIPDVGTLQLKEISLDVHITLEC